MTMDKTTLYSTLLAMLVVALAGLAIATATAPSMPKAATPPARGQAPTFSGAPGAGPGDQRGSSQE